MISGQMKQKSIIALLPLDERPCNCAFPVRLFSGDHIEILHPDRLGSFRKRADPDRIRSFLETSSLQADAMVLSLDMLLYGGLIPSRLHHEPESILLQRLEVLRSIRRKRPELTICAFHCIMRCPDYSSSEEEPEYYGTFGKEIHDYGEKLHREKEGCGLPDQAGQTGARIPPQVLDDYVERRKRNLSLNIKALELIEDGTIDALVIPQDDCSRYGYPAMDRIRIEEEVTMRGLSDRVMTYPGADEAALTLISRCLSHAAGVRPKCFVRYVNEQSRALIPLYEGQALEKTVAAHLRSAGCAQTLREEEADFALVLTGPTQDMLEAEQQMKEQGDPLQDRNLPSLIAFIQSCLKSGLPVTIGDNAYANGGDLALIHALNDAGLLMKVAGYAGWNTNANTLGTAIAQAAALLYRGRTAQHDRFLLERYIEDAGYCARVRTMAMELAEDGSGCAPDLSGREAEFIAYIQSGLELFLEEELSSISAQSTLFPVSLPWHRLFEIDLEAGYQE